MINKYDVIVATETWLNDNINNSEILNSDYVVYRRDRCSVSAGREGGGVLVAVSKSIESTCIDAWQSNVEDIWIRLKIRNGNTAKYLLICAVYLPPPVTLATLEHFVGNTSKILDNVDDDVMILGDFNIGFIEWEKVNMQYGLSPTNYGNSMGCTLVDFLSQYNLSQINYIKNCNNRILDLVLSNVQHCIIDSPLIPISIVDRYHPPLEVQLDFRFTKPLKKKQDIRFNFARADYDFVNAKLELIDWSCLRNSSDVDALVNTFYMHINTVINETVPVVKPRSLRYPIWFSRSLIKILKEKEKLRKRFKIYKNERDEIEIRLLNKRAQVLMRKCYGLYIRKMEDNIASNPKQFWSFVHSKRSNASSLPSEMRLDDICMSSGNDICDLFASYFSSVFSSYDSSTHINNSFNPTNNSESLCTFPQSILSTLTFTERDVMNVIRKINSNKGCGPDGIPPLFIKKCALNLVKPLAVIFNISIKTGVPQGSHLGPILFLVFVNDIVEVIKYSKFSLFADDLKLYKSISVSEDSDLLQQDLQSVQEWCDANRMVVEDEGEVPDDSEPYSGKKWPWVIILNKSSEHYPLYKR
ncbi:uncharacterized protein LOC128200839 [Galleria mellonella]|uniref:Uncharacterized protein LOC128200839 n=1 Tax=Galleria mellonella TaxID=7137 RepID=A0ABM3MJD8_GALME|nr:uncharacterized protein LOC128200839 [Galleria mellonella]